MRFSRNYFGKKARIFRQKSRIFRQKIENYKRESPNLIRISPINPSNFQRKIENYKQESPSSIRILAYKSKEFSLKLLFKMSFLLTNLVFFRQICGAKVVIASKEAAMEGLTTSLISMSDGLIGQLT